VADEIRCDLIVLGTHGRTGLGRLLLGSVAEQVRRRANCPVLTVRHLSPIGDSAGP
jgi:nucleotide-binding universal stress UspA family protein